MLSFLLLGVGLALLHHFYYKYLDGQAVQEHPHQQQLANGIGTGFAFATKMFLALAVSTAYTQRIWKTAREKPFSLRGLDAMFSATTNATAFFTYEMILHWSSFLALIVWLIPIAAVVPPSTLTIKPKAVGPGSQLLSMPSPNFATASLAAERPPPPLAHLPVIQPKILSNTYTHREAPPFHRRQSSSNNVYNGPKPSLSRLAMTVLLTGDIRPISAPVNASYALEFPGPSISCEAANATLLETLNLDPGAPGYTTDFLATVPEDNPWQLQVAQGPGGLVNGSRNASGIVCQVYNATYNVYLNFTNGQQTLNVTSITLQRSTPLPDKTSSEDIQIINYRAFMEAFTNPIVGNVSHSPQSVYTVSSSVLETQLAYGPDLQNVYVDRPLLHPSLTLKSGIEALWQNYTLSLLNSELSDLNISTVQTKVQISLTQNAFAYNAKNLILAYGIAVFFATSGVFVGVHARLKNGEDHSNSFSSIFCTTRNTGLAGIQEEAGPKFQLEKFQFEGDRHSKRQVYWKLENSKPAAEGEALISGLNSA